MTAVVVREMTMKITTQKLTIRTAAAVRKAMRSRFVNAKKIFLKNLDYCYQNCK